MGSRFSSANIRGAIWALRAARGIARKARRAGIDGPLNVPRVPSISSSAERGIKAALRRTNQTCLVEARVMQAWRASQGHEIDMIIGVTAPSKGFRAHAWLEGDPPCHQEGFTELFRRGIPRKR